MLEEQFIRNLFLLIGLALVGGIIAKLLRGFTLIGFIIAGILGSLIIPISVEEVEGLAQFGLILLLFSVGLELSFKRLLRVGHIAFVGAVTQMVLVTLILQLILSLIGFSYPYSLVLALGFSLSSTAIVIKLLSERGELESISGEIMVGWLLVQDLAVIPIMAFLPALINREGSFFLVTGQSLLTALILVSLVFFMGKLLVPFLIHSVAQLNSRELLVAASISLALGTAFLTSLFGVSPALGAFLAGVVISETQENHAIFAETRPLRDLFVTLFFVTLGFLVTPSVLISNFGLIVFLAFVVLIVKSLVIFGITNFLGYKGKTGASCALGLSQVGEFSFVIFLAGRSTGALSSQAAPIGIAITLITLLLTPVIFKYQSLILRRLKILTSGVGVKKEKGFPEFKNHIIVCGYGRVGGWIGKALGAARVPFVVIDYNYATVGKVRMMGIPVVYGDPSEPEVLEAAGIRFAKAVIVAIPDLVTQEEVISYTQNVAPKVKIIARAHLDEEWEKLTALKVDKVVQPEFEAALTIIRDIFLTMGKSKEEVAEKIKGLRVSHSLIK